MSGEKEGRKQGGRGGHDAAEMQRAKLVDAGSTIAEDLPGPLPVCRGVYGGGQSDW